MSVAPGELVLEHATRSFSVRADHGRTLKQLFLGRRRDGSEPEPRLVHALRDVSLRVAPGETVGLVGRNGAGKTSTLKVLAGIVPLQSGRAEVGGRVVSLLELGAGFGRDLTGRENIYLGAALHGLVRHEVDARVERIIAFSELGDFIDVPVRTYSQGMFLRLGFAIAAHLDPDVLLIDEVLAVGDESFQRRCLRRISEQIAGGTTLVLVSHEPAQIERVCERVIVLEGGHVVFDGPTAEGLLAYHAALGVERESRATTTSERAVQIAELELQDGAGRRTRVFHSGEPLRVVLGLESPRLKGSDPVADVVVEVRGADGALAFRTTEAVALGADGRARVVWDVRSLALLGGDYDLAVAGDGGPPSRLASFSVAQEPGGDEGVAALSGTWRPAPVEVAG